MIDVMFDLETFGTTPGSDLRSIGACVFDIVDGWVGGWEDYAHDPDATFYAATIRSNRLAHDADTMRWWSQQSAEALAAFENPIPLEHALANFATWLADIAGPSSVRLWAHGPQFDVSILDAAYRAVGGKTPWHYRAPRDTRTWLDACGIDDHIAWLSKFPGPMGVPHHALDDAICQARAVVAARSQFEAEQRELFERGKGRG